ncbi:MULTISPECIES: heme o synthase [unclassified Bosea (in: a-proteobacteria)]|uniref:heme o synthase n=1 Tax=unclassified Bosea (in: a-proteobacteria) TaxID=2653178 RepID=UPI000F757008|nr:MULTISPECIES: heme o synthase [unclassified Bosea (in: a-proteobacteria)]AZO78752.1 protoheme IX farnesyltransferase [Bosea sp. Tri-49]RXT17461.1 protoheme IX farnesyltransferase [Bosea sp. Tri-39]RXT40832.1 protoheme IX farnesyltransferase [Bosea sp. Tri-54]
MSAAFDQIPQADDGVSLSSTGEARDFFELLKPRVMFLVVVTALGGMVAAPGTVNPVIGFAALLAIAVGAGASGCLNMWWDADIDAVMARTAGRPIPAGRILPSEALAFGLTLSVGSVLVLGLVANLLSAAMLAFTIFFYAVIYSMWLKRATPQNIVIGGAAGAFPPMIGEAVVTGDFGLTSIVLFAIIFLWTPPHFWALALVKSDDYARAGIPMLPNVAGPAATRRQIVAYTLVLAPVAVLPALMGFGGLIYLVVSVVTGLAMIGLSLRVLRVTEGEAANKAAYALFGFSILYLFLLFAVLLAENGLGLMWALPKVLG